MRKSIVVIMILSFMVAAPAIAHEGDHEEFEREVDGEEREIKIERGTYKMSIESSIEIEREQREQEQSFEMQFSVEEHPSIELEREFENETATSEQENETSYEVTFTDLRAVDDTGEQLDDAVYDLEDAEFRPLNYTTHTSDGTTVHEIEAMTADGVFGLRLYASGDFTSVDGESIGPQEVKIDVEIRNRSREDGYVGLLTEVDSESTSELEFEDGQEIKQETSSGKPQAFFSWKDTAQVDGTRTDVLTRTIRSDEDEHDILFMYEPGSTIIHDPKVGLSTADTGGGFLSWLWSLLFGWL